MIPFAKWLPDLYNVNATVAGIAKGVMPGANSYAPWPLPVQFSEALGATCLGAITTHASDGTINIFAGTETGLFKYVGPADPWTDMTRLAGGDYNVPDDERWSFAQFGDTLIAVNANDVPQSINILSGTNFAALAGSPPEARFARIVGDFVVLGGLTDNFNRLHWSGRNNPTFWTPGTQDCDFQDFPDGGIVRGLVDIETMLVFQEHAIRQFVPVDSRAVFSFERVEEGRGLAAADSLVALGRAAFYLSEDGFYATNPGGQSLAIGADAVDRWFFDEADNSRIFTTVGAADPIRQRIIWLFPSQGNASAILDRALCYDAIRQQWTYAEIDASFILPAATAGYTTDNIETLLTSLGYTLETAPFSFDARFLQGGASYLAIFDEDQKLAFFSGANMAAVVETPDFQPIPGRRSYVRGVKLATDATAATVKIGSKDRPQGTIAFGASSSTQNTLGNCPVRATGHYHRIRAELDEGDDWVFLQGIEELDVVPEGKR